MDFFSEKSEKPTSKRLKKAKEEGRFAYSPRLAAALFLLAALCLCYFFSFRLIPLFRTTFNEFLSLLQQSEETILFTLPTLLAPLAKQMGLLILLLIVLAFLAHGWQNQFFFSFNRKRASQQPHRGYSLIYTLFSWSAVALILYAAIHSFVLSDLYRLSLLIAFAFLFLFLALGVVDYLAQRHFFYKDMYMTKQELKEELKEEEVAKYKK